MVKMELYKDNEHVSAFAAYKKIGLIQDKNSKKQPKSIKNQTRIVKSNKDINRIQKKTKKNLPKINPKKIVEAQKLMEQKESKSPKPTSSKTKQTDEDSNDDEPPKLVKSPKRKLLINNELKTNHIKIYKNITDDFTKESTTLFEWLLSPVTPTVFFNEFWEEKPLHIARKKPKYYTTILDSTKLDKIFRENQLFYTRNVDVVSYENQVKEVHNQEGRAVPTALWDYYTNGCSIRVLNPQTYNKKVHTLLATLQEYFGSMVGANVYLTPPGSQGFAPHFDDIEAFVVQLEGRKHWKLYKPQKQDVLARNSSKNFTHDELDKPFLEITLEAGDLLYFPRGVIHEGSTDADAHSLHITISVYQHNAYVDLLEHILPDALQKAAENDVEFRRGLPLNYLKDLGVINGNKNNQNRGLVREKVKKLINVLTNYLDIDVGVDKLGKKFMYDSMPPISTKNEEIRTAKGDGDYLMDGKVFNRVEISLDTKIRLFRYHCIRLVIEDVPRLYYNTENANYFHGEEEQWLQLDERMIESIKILQNNYPNYVEVEKLPLDDVTLKLQLIADLWERGLIVTQYPLPKIDEDSDCITSEED